MAWAILAVLVITAFVLIGMYNSLVQLRVRTDTAWSDIDVQLKRRHDLIPNLVETVKGYAAHEKGTFENVARYRSMAMSATTTSERAEAEGQLTMALKGLLAVAEAYPQLQASQQFRDLQNSLSGLESDIQNSRRYFNAVVRDLNTKITRFDNAITIDKDGHALVTEKIGLRFEGEYHGVHRRIPIHYPGPSGTSFTLLMDVVSVTDGDTHERLRFEDHRQGDYRELTIY